MAAASSSLTPSTQRPIPLQAREDIIFERIEYLGIGYWVAKEPVGLKYYRLQPEQYHALQLLDGERSLEQIREELQRQLPTVRLQYADIQHLVTDLHEKGLVYSKRPGQGIALIKHHREQKYKKMMNTMRSLLYLRLPGWDPEPTLQVLYPIVKFLFRPWCVALTWLVVFASWILLTVQFDEFRSQLPAFQQFFGWPNLIYLWLTLAISKIIHEFGHGLSCKHFGGECHEMGVMLLVFSPCLYCDVSDSWVLKNKWKRIMIGAAGMYIEIFLSAIAIFIWWNTQPGLLHNLALNVFFVTTITTVIFNANPLMRFDGYYMMSDFLEIPNLRPKADRMLRESFAWYCLGIESRPDPFMPETGKVWFVLFAISAWIYRWFILAGITIFLYTVLKPYNLQSIGITLAVVSIGTIFGNMIFNIYKIITAPRIEPMSRPKIAATLSVLVLVIAVGLAMPIPWHIEAMFIIEPHNVRHVYSTTPGRMMEIKVAENEMVVGGDTDGDGDVDEDDNPNLLVILSNDDKEDQLNELKLQETIQVKAQIPTFEALDDPTQSHLAEKKLATIRGQIKEYQRQIRELKIVAPIGGRVVPPSRTPEPKLVDGNAQLSQWHGTPLDKRNYGSFVDSRTHIASIAPDEFYQAVLLVDQGNRNDIMIGQEVELKFDHLPGTTYIGSIEDISDRHLEFVPELLSNKLGGEIPTVTDSQGRERLQSIAYQTTVLLEEDVALLRTGMRGRARFLVDSRSLGEWLWRYLNRTFRFRL
ncbi:MAG: hypothetical protein CMJ78_22665 [Planctomycetaceae bacterium]|nr:hypothetical protein [Planctomycetaceae bacterium]